MNNENEFIMKS